MYKLPYRLQYSFERNFAQSAQNPSAISVFSTNSFEVMFCLRRRVSCFHIQRLRCAQYSTRAADPPDTRLSDRPVYLREISALIIYPLPFYNAYYIGTTRYNYPSFVFPVCDRGRRPA